MTRFYLTFIFFLIILSGSEIYSRASDNPCSVSLKLADQDSLFESQILYNGRVWRNLYYKVREDQFLFSPDFLRGSVTINGKSFKNISLRYDIYNDEIMTITNHGSVLQLNKEMVDSFNLIFQDRRYYFTKIQEDTLKGFTGYMNVLSSGKTPLFVKYKKEIELLAVDKKFDEFYQIHRIYFMKDGFVKLINSKKEFLNLLEDKKLQIRNFIKKNRLRISKKDPYSFLPVIGYYNSLEN
jgi:hypothetical protein